MEIVALCALITFTIRALPHIFTKHLTLGEFSKQFPFFIMALLVIYCLRGSFQSTHTFIQSLVGVISVYIIHKLYHHMILTIILSTSIYMLMGYFL